ncbi:MAG TPA: GFA family protein [Stenotrophomonas sp.]|jgi:hypothetical protein
MQYEGSCHCGRIGFTLNTETPITEAMDCNCSLCRRRGGLLWFGPRAALVLNTATADVGLYQFNQQHLQHHHCPVCGVAPFSEGTDPRSNQPMVAVNVRCLPAVDLSALTITAFDGARL